jgi:hypothetical protein
MFVFDTIYIKILSFGEDLGEAKRKEGEERSH